MARILKRSQRKMESTTDVPTESEYKAFQDLRSHLIMLKNGLPYFEESIHPVMEVLKVKDKILNQHNKDAYRLGSTYQSRPFELVDTAPLKKAFEADQFKLHEMKTADEIDKVAKDMAKKVETPDYEMTTDEEGKATCKDLPVGVYLVYVENLADFETITPFIVGIPTWDDEDELFQYDVTVYPKHTALPRILVNKVDSVTGQNIKSNKFEFTSYSQENCAESSKLETIAGDQENGTAEFLIRYGTTYIKESSAPQGYKLSDEVVKVKFTDEGLFVNDKEVHVDDNHRYSIVYQNVLLPSVNTGTAKNKDMMYMMLGIVVIALGASIATVRKIRKSED